MASKTVKQGAVLAVLVAILAGVLIFWGEETPTGTAARPSNPVSGTTGTGQQPRAGQLPVTDIQLEALSAPREDAPVPERNLFRFEVKAPPPPPLVPRLPMCPPHLRE